MLLITNTDDDGATQVQGNVCSVLSRENFQKSHASVNPYILESFPSLRVPVPKYSIYFGLKVVAI